jgi:putative hemolysin
MSYLFEIVIIIVLILINGFLALSEFAIVSARKRRLRQRAKEGNERAAVALELAENPTPFLSTIQIGITLVGILAGAFGGATIARGLAVYFQKFPALVAYSDIMSIGLVVLVITYLTLIFGELVPKRLALDNAERIAPIVAKPIRFIALLAKPVEMILSLSTNTVLRIFKVRGPAEPSVTEEDIRGLLEDGTKAGIVEKVELKMIKGIFDIGDQRAESLMTPRPYIIALDLEDPNAENLQKMIESGRTIFPVYEGHLDSIVGVVSVKDVLANIVNHDSVDIRSSVKSPVFAPEAIPVLKLLDVLKEKGSDMALLVDEYGSIQGIITLHDVLEAIVGSIRPLGERPEMPVIIREDGSLLIDGDTALADVKDILKVGSFPGEELEQYRTLGGMVVHILQRIPTPGDHFEMGGIRYEVLDVDGNRVDKVLVMRIQKTHPNEQESLP